jgi:isopentenyldiphosphate isomerase
MRIIIVNDQDMVIGNKERNMLGPEDMFRVTALWITNSHGDILLAQRKHTKKNNPSKWGPAVAGTVEEDETYDSNIIKEADEEIGLKDIMPSIGPKQLVRGDHIHFCQWYILLVNKPIEAFAIQEEEVDQIRWFSHHDLERALGSHPEQFVNAMQQGIDLLTRES